MKAVHFGAGNIGRGFIGCLLSKSGYETTFLDVNEELVSLINQQRSYRVETLEDEPQIINVDHVQAIHSQREEQKAVTAIAHADLVTTAVGPNVLPLIAPLIARGLIQRLAQHQQPLNVIACENMLNSSQELKKHVLSCCTPEEQKQIKTWIGFPNAVVDRIVPNQSNQDPLSVKVEPYFEWVVDQKELKGERVAIQGIHLVDNFEAYVVRKLFTVNTGHAVAAYLGYQAGYATITEAMNDPEIVTIVKGCLAETSQLMTQLFEFASTEHQHYVNQIISRFQNPYITDQVTRVARSPMRKLSSQERLVLPAVRLLDIGIKPLNLATGISAALAYDWREDPEAVQLQKNIKQKGAPQVLAELAQLNINHPLIQLVEKRLS